MSMSSAEIIEHLKPLLRDTLQLGKRAAALTASSRLLGTIPEFDSMAVVSVITLIEEQFDITIAEEMNKCRRMIAEAANALAALGVAALVPDLFGTGDSEGEFRDADWETWKADLDTAVAWASEEGWPVKG